MVQCSVFVNVRRTVVPDTISVVRSAPNGYSVAVKSTVAGTLVASLAGEGDTVSQGAIIARLDVTS